MLAPYLWLCTTSERSSLPGARFDDGRTCQNSLAILSMDTMCWPSGTVLDSRMIPVHERLTSQAAYILVANVLQSKACMNAAPACSYGCAVALHRATVIFTTFIESLCGLSF